MITQNLEKLKKKNLRLVRRARFFNMWTHKVAWPIIVSVLVALIVISILSLFERSEDVLLFESIIFVFSLVVFGLNFFVVFLGIATNSNAFHSILQLNKMEGRPIKSLHGFEYLENKIKENQKLTKGLLILTLLFTMGYILFILIDWFSPLFSFGSEIQSSALGLLLIIIAILMNYKPMNVDIGRILGLIQFHSTKSHQITMRTFFTDCFYEHIDPVTRLKYDEFIEIIKTIVKPEFVKHVHEMDELDDPIKYATEQMLYLAYLDYRKTIDENTVIAHLSEIINTSTPKYDYINGADVGAPIRYFSRKDIFNVFKNGIEKYTPKIFNIIDRVQIDVIDNLVEIANQQTLLEVIAEESINDDGVVNLLVFIFNNTEKEKQFMIDIFAPNFQPDLLKLTITVEGRGNFRIPTPPDGKLKICDDSQEDCVGVISNILKNAEMLWLSFKPQKNHGLDVISIFLSDEFNRIIKGQTVAVQIQNNKIGKMIKDTSSFGIGTVGAIFAFYKIFQILIDLLVSNLGSIQGLQF